MEKDLLQRELDTMELSYELPWKYPKNAFSITQIDDLVKLFETSLTFGEYYQHAVNNKFIIKGRISIVNAQWFFTNGGTSSGDGFTDKKKGQAFLKDTYNNGLSTIEAAVHEVIHLISHPLTGKHQNDITFAKRFSYPLMEAVTQYFTRVMMIEAGIKNWKTSTYQNVINDNLKPLFRIFEKLQIDYLKKFHILCELVFKNNVTLWVNCIAQQLMMLNSALTKSEASNWANQTDLFVQLSLYKETVIFIDYIIRKDYSNARQMYSKAIPRSH